MIYLFIIVCICMYIFLPCATELGVSSDNLTGAFTYMYVHASVIHLIINIVCMFAMYRPIKNLYAKRFGFDSDVWFFTTMLVGSVLAGLFTAGDVPTVGASGMIFFMLGELLMLNPTFNQLKNYIYVALGVAIQIYFGNSNVPLHIVAFIIGALFVIIHRFIEYKSSFTDYDNI